MRIVHWLYVLSVVLFVFGIGFIVAGARTLQRAAPVEPPVTAPVASVLQIMNGITDPAATAIYNSVGGVVDATGFKEVAPQTDEEWRAVADSAAALVESGNLLLIGSRAVDNGDWLTMTRAMMDVGQRILAAAEAKDKDGVLTTGSELNPTCDNCHAKYQRQ
jgi:hypothetical protein